MMEMSISYLNFTLATLYIIEISIEIALIYTSDSPIKEITVTD